MSAINRVEAALYAGAGVPLERPVPYDLPAEEAVIGALLFDRDAIRVVADWLEPGHFYREANGWIYEVIGDLYQRREPPDMVTLSSELDRRGLLAQVGGAAYLAHCLNATPHAGVHVEYYGRVVERCGMLRRVITLGGQVAGLGYEEGLDLDDVLERVERLVLGTTQSRKRQGRDTTDRHAISAYMDGLEQRLAGQAAPSGWRIPGFPQLTRLLRGCRPGKLVVITAPPGGGKSTLVSALALALKQEGARTGLFSLEMDQEELAERELGSRAGVDTDLLAAGKLTRAQQDKVQAAYARLIEEAPLRLVTGGGFTLRDIAAQARRWQADGGLHILAVDYLGLVRRPGHGNEVAELDDLINGFKSLAAELGVTAIIPSQLANTANGKPPDEWDLHLRGSGAIRQAADIILALAPDEDPPDDPTVPQRMTIYILKHRGGKVGKVTCYWWKAYNRIGEGSEREDYE